MRTRVLSRVLIASLLTGAFGVAALPSPAAVGATAHRVRPGAMVDIAEVKCRVALMLHQGRRVYAAVPASCTALPLQEGAVQDGCSAATAPVGTPVDMAGASKQPILVYNSFTYMQSMGVTKRHKCYYDDLALLKLKPIDARRARAAGPSGTAVRSVSRSGPASGSTVTFGAGTAVAGATTKGGWVYQLSAAPAVDQSDVGTSLTKGATMFGMLTVIPQGTVMKSPAEAYNLYRALRICRTAKGFHHVRLM